MSADRENQRGVRHFASFMLFVSRTAQKGSPLEQAREAWATMVAELKWSPSYAIRAHSSLMRVLLKKEPELARGLVVNNLRHGKWKILTEFPRNQLLSSRLSPACGAHSAIRQCKIPVALLRCGATRGASEVCMPEELT